MSLSDKMWDESGKGDTLLNGQDVREAVKELKEYLLHNAEVNRDHCITFIDEIFGEKLI